METTETKLRIVTQESRTVRSRPIRDGDKRFVAYRRTSVTSITVQGESADEKVSVVEGITIPQGIITLTSTEALGVPAATVKQGDYDAPVVCVFPGWLEAMRDYGWIDYEKGVAREDLIVMEPLTALEKGLPVEFYLVNHACHRAFALDGQPIPVRLDFEYISGHMDNAHYRLDEAARILLARSDVVVDSDRANPKSPGDYINWIPGYNASPGCDRYISFEWHPTMDDYRRVYARAMNYPRPSWMKGKKGTPVSSDDLYQACFDEDIFGLRAGGAALFDDFNKSAERSTEEDDV